MKNILALLFVLITGLSHAQTDTSYWNKGGSFGIYGSQASFHNWAKGGQDQVALTTNLNLFAKYLKGGNSWDNLFIADLGTSKQGDQDFRKSEDRLELNSKYGYQASKKWYYSALFNFKSQFLAGYEYPTDSTEVLVSNFLVPGYIKTGLGMDYKPNEYLSVFMSPITARWTIVNDQELADEGKYGLEPAERDTAGNIISHASKVRSEFGALLRLAYTQDVWTNVNFGTILELYSDYLSNPENIDIDWQFVFNFKVNSLLNAQLKGHLIYDDDVPIGIDSDDDGNIDSYGPRTQFNQALSLGFVYKF